MPEDCLRSGVIQGYALSPLLFDTVLQVLANAMRQEKEGKRYRLGRKKSNCVYLQMPSPTEEPGRSLWGFPSASKVNTVAQVGLPKAVPGYHPLTQRRSWLKYTQNTVAGTSQVAETSGKLLSTTVRGCWAAL